MVRWLMMVSIAAALVLGLAEPSEAWHWGWGHRYYYYPYPYRYVYPYPYAYPPPVLVQPPQPPVYIQQPPAQASSWYWCRQPEGYYPHVQRCPEGWLPVPPQSSPSPPPRIGGDAR